MDTYTFGTWLRRRRKALDWTQAELARRAHCTAATIRKIEADERKPSRELAESLADALSVPPKEREAFLQAARNVQAVDQLTRVVVAPIAERAPNNLPAPLTSFIDRVNDNAIIVEMLTRDDARLLSLIGPPGIGKTRLCIRVGENVTTHFPDGVWFVDLASVAEPTQVLPTIARALNIAESGAQKPLQQLRNTLGDKRVLLALDNFEQVIDAAPNVVELLNACKGLRVLATSRVPLRVYGEHEYVLPPMSIPPRELTPDQLIAHESAQLFIARLREHQPRFALTLENATHIAEVCIRLDGVPLALELAAASLRRMTLEQLVDVLTGEPHWLASLQTPARDLPPRQRTLYSAIAWSYSLLDTPTQTIFRQLGILVGGFDLEAAIAICEQDARPIETALATLTDHSLLARESSRWRMLEMIREFALEQLSADELLLAQQRHAKHFATRLQTIESDVSRVEIDHDNFRAALRWAIRAHDGGLDVRMGTVLANFWETRGYLREGLAWAREVLAIADKVEPRLQIDFLSSAGHLAWNKHAFDAAMELTNQGIALAWVNALDDELAGMFNVLGRIFIEQGDYAHAEQTLRDCIGLAEKIHDADNVTRATTQLGEVALACGRLDEAQSLSEQASDLLGNRISRFIAMAHTNLAEVALARGDDASAREELQRAAPHIHEHVRRVLCFCVTLAGWLVAQPRAHQNDVRRGAELLGAVEMITERTGAPLSALYYTLNERRMEMAQRRLTEREWQEAWNRGRAMKIEQAVEYAGEVIQSG